MVTSPSGEPESSVTVDIDGDGVPIVSLDLDQYSDEYLAGLTLYLRNGIFGESLAEQILTLPEERVKAIGHAIKTILSASLENNKQSEADSLMIPVVTPEIRYDRSPS